MGNMLISGTKARENCGALLDIYLFHIKLGIN